MQGLAMLVLFPLIEWERAHDQVWDVTRRETVEARALATIRSTFLDMLIVQVKPGSGEKRTTLLPSRGINKSLNKSRRNLPL